ncbi:hypothetical protein CPAR01_13413 [Colletotrichum paranaense]|uniref:Uncharacterized protein n=1 Tax=Colletotrichum paranaense TaxID=1914294 RepID=A0ABQ9S6M1_9PEZI|nr:uncharacterized protein CPAR01_13413 [Colletotrichum paranaense]KAK1526885.1 hypothetical protein CPAR01_13413 [Colletotrichum paranaense]
MGGKENPTSSHSSSRPPTGVQLHSAPTDPGTHSTDGPPEMRDPGVPGYEENRLTSCWTFPWTRQSGQHAGNRLSGGSSALPLVMPSSWALQWLDPVWQVQDINSGETSLGNFLNMSECGCSLCEIQVWQWYGVSWTLGPLQIHPPSQSRWLHRGATHQPTEGGAARVSLALVDRVSDQ